MKNIQGKQFRISLTEFFEIDKFWSLSHFNPNLEILNKEPIT